MYSRRAQTSQQQKGERIHLTNVNNEFNNRTIIMIYTYINTTQNTIEYIIMKMQCQCHQLLLKMHVILKSKESEVCYWFSHFLSSSLNYAPLWMWDLHSPSLNQAITGLKSYLTPKYMHAWSCIKASMQLINIISKTSKHSKKGSTIEPIGCQSQVSL